MLYRTLLGGAIAVSLFAASTMAGSLAHETEQLRQTAMPQVTEYADGYLFEAPKTRGFVVMNVRIYDQTGNKIHDARTVGEPLEFIVGSLPDGKYRYESVVVSKNLNATVSDISKNPGISEITSRAVGQFEVRNGQHVLSSESVQRNPSRFWSVAFAATRQSALTITGWVVGSANAQNVVVDGVNPELLYNDTDYTQAFYEFTIRVNDKSFEIIDLIDNVRFFEYQSSENSDSGTNSIGIAANGDIQLADGVIGIDRATGRVGIGTTSPIGNFDIRSAAPYVRFFDESDSQPGWIGYNGDALQFLVPASASGLSVNQAMAIQEQAPLNSLVISSQGFVGLGTSTPAANLSFDAPDPEIRFTNPNTGDNNIGLKFSNNFLRIKGRDGQDLGKMHTRAPVGTFTTDASGRTGYGTATPEASFNVKYRGAHGAVPVFLAQAANNDEIFRINLNGNATLAGTLTQNSDINAKMDIELVDSQLLLEKVSALPISQWQYRGAKGINHIGPMAQDFHAAFGLGDSETQISTLDTSGVALAAIQALAAENARLQSVNRQQEVRLAKLEGDRDRLALLEAVVASMATAHAKPMHTTSR